MRRLTVMWQDTISKVLGTLDVPDDATPEQITELVNDFGETHYDGGGLCYQCTHSVGETSGSDEFVATDERGQDVVPPYFTGMLIAKIAKLEQENAALRAQLDAK